MWNSMKDVSRHAERDHLHVHLFQHDDGRAVGVADGRRHHPLQQALSQLFEVLLHDACIVSGIRNPCLNGGIRI